ncbi:hypothetical protein [Bartonella tamiae]|uniref:Uncharacterized protein n=1 Tax=Bartonella tamiae Th239 TaxID=1094558 RepID=J0R044_9HYPH|nr:hypothetical protein [Bartonella tamiae]EJF88874.1 hypothetical protein ME5_01425 [Bartonella tamiae Th239]EJF94876.1 hypothetical protein MEG_00457 [Bartonella tamiae Th307]
MIIPKNKNFQKNETSRTKDDEIKEKSVIRSMIPIIGTIVVLIVAIGITDIFFK